MPKLYVRDLVAVTAGALAAMLGFLLPEVIFAQQSQTSPTQSTPTRPSAKPAPEVSLPEDAHTILSLGTVRTITGVKSLDTRASISTGSDGTGGVTQTSTRYGTSIYVYPQSVSDKSVKIRAYQGRSAYGELNSNFYQYVTGDNDWKRIDTRLLTRTSDVPEAFTVNRYAKNGSVISTLCFIFKDSTVEVETSNLPASNLLPLAKAALAGMYKLNVKGPKSV